jgi:hypothetical protein
VIADPGQWSELKWRRSAKGNLWVRVEGWLITVFRSELTPGFHFAVDDFFSHDTFPTEEAAMLASYDGFAFLSRYVPKKPDRQMGLFT